MSDEELMDGYEAALKAKHEGIAFEHVDTGNVARWVQGCFAWDRYNAVDWSDLAQKKWRVVDEPDEPGPPDGCELWPVIENPTGIQLQVDTGDGTQPLCTIAAEPRFRGWGYMVGGELKISAIPIAYTDGNRLVGNKNEFQDDVIRPDYAVMAKEGTKK